MVRKFFSFLLPLSFVLQSLLLFAESPELSVEDEQFLDLVEKKSLEFFLKEHHPETGLVKDKASNMRADTSFISSIAATGFGLGAICVGAERGWIEKKEAERYCLKTLRFFLTKMEDTRGFVYHFVHWGTGKKMNHSEVSSIDTALFLAGALTAGEYFKGTEVEQLANRLYEKVDFQWMLNGGETLSMGWDPDKGFLKSRWDSYNESFILYLLAVGSRTHPIHPESWHKVKKRIGIYGPHVFIACPPLFTHQYSAVWVDFKNKNDGFADYFENSRIATIVNREFCLDQREKYKTYSENVWGLTASLSPDGYKAYGAEPGGAIHDGTVAPTAAGSSIVFTPELSLEALKFMYENHRDQIWGKYGFSDAFNLDRNWFASEVLGIDQGPLLLMIENFRTGLIWRLFMQHPSAVKGMKLLGFRPGTIKLSPPKRPKVVIEAAKSRIKLDGLLNEWDSSSPLKLHPTRHRELGEISGPSDLSAKFYFAWTPKYLYVAARVVDDSVVLKRTHDKIWKDDCIELFFDPEENQLQWGNAKDAQLGFSPWEGGIEGRTWAWFQGYDPTERGLVQSKMRRTARGYNLEARISWEILRMVPKRDRSFGFTPAIHDIDLDESEGKLNWFFLSDGKTGKFILGRALLRGSQIPAKRD